MTLIGEIELVPRHAITARPLGAAEEIRFDVCNQYTLQADAFARSILEDTPVPTPLSDAIANMRVIERVVASAGSGTWA